VTRQIVALHHPSLARSTLNPDRIPSRLTLIARMGAERGGPPLLARGSWGGAPGRL